MSDSGYPDDLAAAQVDDYDDDPSDQQSDESSDDEDDGDEETDTEEDPDADTTPISQAPRMADRDARRVASDPAIGRPDNSGGFITDGLSQTEMIALLGVTAISYALAWGVLDVMGAIGFDDAPNELWLILGALVSVPLLVLFGVEVLSRLLQMARR